MENKVQQEEKDIQPGETDPKAEKKEFQAENQLNDQADGEGVASSSVAEKEEAMDPLKKLQDELAEAKDKYVRLYAEFENHRRRTSKEKLEMIQSANEQLIAQLLPVIDDFERAEKAFSESREGVLEGFLLIHNKLKKILELHNVKVMEVGKGSDFDPDFHEAITQVKAEEKDKGKIVDIIENGYLLNEKVIRYAKVVVGN